MRLYLPLCFLDRHVPNRRAAVWDGTTFVSTCKYCRKKVRRRDHGHWVRDRTPDTTET